MRRTPPLIIGGGPAGSAAAIVLGRAGLRPTLIERSAGPRDVVCGGFLGADALAMLARLGIDVEALGAEPIRRVRLVAHRRTFETGLPWPAAGLSRRVLDEAMLAEAAASGAELVRGCAVRALDTERRSARLEDGSEIDARCVVLATGKHELRGAARDLAGMREAPSVGLRSTFRPTSEIRASLQGHVELHLFDGGYAGLLMQEDGRANLCISVRRELLASAGSIEGVIGQIARTEPLFEARLAAARDLEWTSVAGVPYGWRSRGSAAGLYRVGDQAAVIASIAGDGVAIALSSGMAAARAIGSAGAGGAQNYQQSISEAAGIPLKLAGAIRWSCERERSRLLLMAAVRAMPWLPPLAARLTRIN